MIETKINPNFRDLTGQQFNFLRVLARAEKFSKKGSAYWRCECVCGNEAIVRTDHLKAGKIKSCGCKVAELVSTTPRKPMNTLGVYNGMKERIKCPSTPSYAHYKERGIRLCRGWDSSFESFLADVGEKPAGKSLDRKNNDLHYSCGHCDECKENGWAMNCQWSTAKEQIRNRSTTVMGEYKGITKPLATWCEELHLPYQPIYARVSQLKWSVAKALETPLKNLIEAKEDAWEAEMREQIAMDL